MVRQPLRYLPFTSGFLNIFGIVLVPPSHFKMCAGNQDEKNYDAGQLTWMIVATLIAWIELSVQIYSCRMVSLWFCGDKA